MTLHSLLDNDALTRFAREQRIDPYHIKRLRYLLLAERRPFGDAIKEIPQPYRTTFTSLFRFELLDLVETHKSQLDRSLRFIFRAADGLKFESVAMHSPTGRTSVCVSSQIGCAMRCGFCATGQMGLLRDLRRDEIIAQVAQVNDLLREHGRYVRNVVFMGMGEPLHNEEGVYAALDRLLSQNEFALSPRRIIVSTVGICDAMLRFATRFPRVGLAISLHTVRQQLRESLIPLARRYPLDQLQQTLRDAAKQLRRPMMIEYLMLQGVNDGLEDAIDLADYLDGLDVHVNLIPYNPIHDGPANFRRTPRSERDRFARILRDRGFLTTIRYSQGGDIGAACGQLIQRASVDG